jgi:predicted dehydrogenase
MEKGNLSRRGFMQRSLTAMAAAGLPAWYAREVFAQGRTAAEPKKPVAAADKIVMGLIGCGGQGRGIMNQARKLGAQFVAVCDVDKGRRKATAKELGKDAQDYEDYRELLDRRDLNAVCIGTVDHWHTLVALDAMRKGKDVYCEKPLTLTIAEGITLVQVANKTKRVFQVGSQQRSDARFRMACELVRNGRLGKIKTVETWIGSNPKGGPFKVGPVPEGLNWDFWQGPTPKVDYVKERCHYNFRWWYEYSGGKLTDWGAHHNDIAQWALGMDKSGPVAVEAKGEKPSSVPNSYNCHPTFKVTYTYASGTKLICTSRENGVRFTGERGDWLFVSRSEIDASDDKLISEPLPAGATRLYTSPGHMRNFLDCVRSRRETICPAEVGHRSVTVCHLGVISLRLGGKKLTWSPDKERFVGDEEANKMLSRPMRGDWKLEA